jgi:hypothetical protein
MNSRAKFAKETVAGAHRGGQNRFHVARKLTQGVAPDAQALAQVSLGYRSGANDRLDYSSTRSPFLQYVPSFSR